MNANTKKVLVVVAFIVVVLVAYSFFAGKKLPDMSKKDD